MTDLSQSREQTALQNIASGGVAISLHTADEGQEPDGSNEVTASDYSRQSVAEADISVSGQSPTVLSIDAEVVWTTSANSAWGTITHFAIWDGSSTPETATVDLDNSQTVESGMEVSATAGSFTLELD